MESESFESIECINEEQIIGYSRIYQWRANHWILENVSNESKSLDILECINVEKIIGCYRMYQWRVNHWML